MTQGARIAGFRLWHVRIPFRSRMRSSRGVADAGEKVILELVDSDGATGLGEASVIFPSRSGETAGTIFVALRDLYCPRLVGMDAMALARVLDSLESATSEQFAFLASKCAIDIALHDLKARRLGVPVCELLGGASRASFALSRSMSIMPTPALVETATKLAGDGYRLLTMKGTHQWREDLAAFQALRAALPDEVMIEIDPNQAWQPKDAIAFDRVAQPLGLECIEQPCAWWDLNGMRLVTTSTVSRIAADESVLSAADAYRVAQTGAADMITIKLAKSGGLRASGQIVDLALKAGLTCNMGSKHPLGVGTAALLHFAAAYPGVGEFLGYGSALERFTSDVIEQVIEVRDGQAFLPEGVGLGVSLDREALARHTLGAFDSFESAH